MTKLEKINAIKKLLNKYNVCDREWCIYMEYKCRNYIKHSANFCKLKNRRCINAMFMDIKDIILRDYD